MIAGFRGELALMIYKLGGPRCQENCGKMEEFSGKL